MALLSLGLDAKVGLDELFGGLVVANSAQVWAKRP